MHSHSCYHCVDEDSLLCTKCKQILTHFIESTEFRDSSGTCQMSLFSIRKWLCLLF